MKQLTATVEIDKKRKRYWLRINKGDSDNKELLYYKGPGQIHQKEIFVEGGQRAFRFWWKSEKSRPYLEALSGGKWSYDKAYDEIRRITGLPLRNPPGNPDRVTFDVKMTGDTYTLIPPKKSG